jgi:predicted acetyltransferase
VEVRAPNDDRDWDGYAAAAIRSFGGDREARARWRAALEPHAVTVVGLDGRRVVGGAMALPVGQHFGGREVPAAAVATVCTVPEARGRGVAASLLRALCERARGAGLLVAPLWSARTRVYHRLGWQAAGRAYRHRVRLDALGGPARGEPVGEPGPEAREVQRRVAPRWNGPLARPGWWWEWREHPVPGQVVERVGWREEGRLTGTADLEVDHRRKRLVVRQLWTSTSDALDGLAAHLAAHRAQLDEALFTPACLPGEPDLLWRLAPGELATRASGPWLVRLLDVPGALVARGWPEAPPARLELEVADPWEPGPRRLVLEVADGAAGVEAGGRGRVRIEVGALAAWYSGGLAATRAAMLGLAEGPEADLAAMDRLTADLPVWLPDRF